MPTKLSDFVQGVQPDSTILFFGAGSSVPSGAPSVAEIIEQLSSKFSMPSSGFALPELTDLIEQRTKDRRRMINELQTMFRRARPTGGLLNVPLYEWKSIYTTNYDTLIEQAYEKKNYPLATYHSNFNFSVSPKNTRTKLYKLHGTIDEDVSIGGNSRIIITEADYNFAHEFRQHLFDTLKAELSESKLIIVGYSLSDHMIKDIINKSITLNSQAYSAGRIALLMYKTDEHRATLYEGRGLEVVFSGIDEFFAEMGKKSPGPLFEIRASDNHLERQPGLVPTTLDVSHEIETGRAEPSRMFNGWPASYADIDHKLTFERTVADGVADYLKSASGLCVLLLGASGVGKTTAARQAMLKLRQSRYSCWEHKSDYTLSVDDWLSVAKSLHRASEIGVLFVDDAHSHLHQLNDLIDALVSEKLTSLVLIMASSRSSWRPRYKTPTFFKTHQLFTLSRLGEDEIDRLLSLIDTNPAIARLLEHSFSGFNRVERRRRLVDRCEADMFVCLRNIFASESFDNIILREFAELSEESQEIYRLVAALETSGVRVHRQLVIRLLKIRMTAIEKIMDNLTDIVSEYTIDPKRHIYGWKGRHPVINEIITKHKFDDTKEIVRLFDLVIDNILPTYEIEIRSIIELCNIETGIARIPDKNVQNRLLAKMVSVATGERVPRHRLIRNLIELNKFDDAQTEIRIFEKDFKRSDGPVTRYKIKLLVERAIRTQGILDEDRLAILRRAQELAVASIRRYAQHAAVLSAYCDVGFQILKLSGDVSCFDDALSQLRDAETRLGDTEITHIIRRYERMKASFASTPEQAEEAAEPEFD